MDWLVSGKGLPQLSLPELAEKNLAESGDNVQINSEILFLIKTIAENEHEEISDIINELLVEALSARGEIEKHPRGILYYEFFGDHSERLIPVKLLGEIAAGKPISVFQEEETVYIDRDLVIEGRTYVLRVKGDSMIEEGILDGDLVICIQASEAYNGQRVVALIDNESATLKTYYRSGKLIRLQPANPMYKPIILLAERVTIQGIVIAIQRRM